MSFRHSFVAISPPWLADGVALGLGYTVGLVLDAYTDAVREGVKARFPGVGTYDALPALGRDVNIERGPSETDLGYSDRVAHGFDTWRIAGSALAILTQLRAYFSPANGPNMRAVSNRAVWHEIDPVNGDVTKTIDGTNWAWDAFGQSSPPSKNHRGWIIVEGSDLWELDVWELADEWGDGGTWGSTATVEEVASIRGIVRKWKAGHNFVPAVIVTFDPALFLADAVPADNPKAPENWNKALPRQLVEANFWSAVRTQGV